MISDMFRVRQFGNAAVKGGEGGGVWEGSGQSEIERGGHTMRITGRTASVTERQHRHDPSHDRRRTSDTDEVTASVGVEMVSGLRAGVLN